MVLARVLRVLLVIICHILELIAISVSLVRLANLHIHILVQIPVSIAPRVITPLVAAPLVPLFQLVNSCPLPTASAFSRVPQVIFRQVIQPLVKMDVKIVLRASGLLLRELLLAACVLRDKWEHGKIFTTINLKSCDHILW